MNQLVQREQKMAVCVCVCYKMDYVLQIMLWGVTPTGKHQFSTLHSTTSKRQRSRTVALPIDRNTMN